MRSSNRCGGVARTARACTVQTRRQRQQEAARAATGARAHRRPPARTPHAAPEGGLLAPAPLPILQPAAQNSPSLSDRIVTAENERGRDSSNSLSAHNGRLSVRLRDRACAPRSCAQPAACAPGWPPAVAMPITLRSGVVVGPGGASAPPLKADPFTDGLDEESTKRLAAWNTVCWRMQ